MFDPKELYIIEHYSSYADEFIANGVAYGMEAAWRVADLVREKYYPAEIYSEMVKNELEYAPGYYHRATPFVVIKSATEAVFVQDFQDLP